MCDACITMCDALLWFIGFQSKSDHQCKMAL